MSVIDDTSTSPKSIHGHNTDCVTEVVIPVPWGHISGKWWGAMDQQPIVALHGLQDNAGSFDSLIQLLSSDETFLTIDLPGHGLSSHVPFGQYNYVLWNGLVALRRISKWWGPTGIQPIVALHGRQDNAGSFDNLIPLLSDGISVLCLDMPGHGLSSHYPKSQYYYVYWDGVILLRRIVKHFKWNKVKLLGHSLGGAISFLYAATYPDEVEFLISLDIAAATIKDITTTPLETGDTIDKFLKYESIQTDNVLSYTYEEAISIAEDGYMGSVTRDGVITLMKRGLKSTSDPKRFSFARDPRLKASGLALMISLDLVLAYAARIKCGYLNIRAVPGMVFGQPEVYTLTLDQIKAGAKRFEYHEVEGTHHVHLNNPERIAPIINKFISTK